MAHRVGGEGRFNPPPPTCSSPLNIMHVARLRVSHRAGAPGILHRNSLLQDIVFVCEGESSF